MAHAHTYSFLLEESVAEATTRIAHEQLDVAITQLTETLPTDPEKAIHNARKAIKRERSLIRLVRGAMPREERRQENGALRDAAQILSGARDADALVATVDALSERFAGQLPERAFTTVRAALQTDGHGHDDGGLAAQRAAPAWRLSCRPCVSGPPSGRSRPTVGVPWTPAWSALTRAGARR